ncbi:rhodanese-like domain-containing protein [Dyella sp. ASV21]|jgi:rhodanese-related sulfurtransferase|uniref:rhodanese-like domain-containing protein n=1 Tax=Dyella sp. ASV21 TaxID=2795114 RepID=UPI0018ECA7BA|nr:rhodanese-like domain-containing protein [Dyella sp. ASV21]
MSDVLHKLPEFISHNMALVALFVVLLLAIIVIQVMMLFRKYKELTPAGLTLLINREGPLMVDLSAYADYEKAHVPGSRHVAMSQFDPEHKELAKAKDVPVVLIDKDGRNTGKAAQRLIKAGFAKVYVLGGGVLAWQQAQLPVSKGKN